MLRDDEPSAIIIIKDHHLHQKIQNQNQKKKPVVAAAADRNQDEAEMVWWRKSITVTTMMAWLRRRKRRYIYLILCSPFLLPLFFLTLPWLCVIHFCCKRRIDVVNSKKISVNDEERGATESATKICVNGGEEDDLEVDEGYQGGKLLQRYLEDQLDLVRSVYYDCGGDDVDDEFSCVVDVENPSMMNRTPLLQ